MARWERPPFVDFKTLGQGPSRQKIVAVIVLAIHCHHHIVFAAIGLALFLELGGGIDLGVLHLELGHGPGEFDLLLGLFKFESLWAKLWDHEVLLVLSVAASAE